MGNTGSSSDEALLPIRGLLAVIGHGQSYRILDRPDHQVRNRKACDMIAELGNCKLAIEHTTVQSMPNQRDRSFRNFFDPLEQELSGRMPKPGRFALYVYPDVTANLSKRAREEVRNRIRDWCIEQTDKLGLDPPKNYSEAQPVGIPFGLLLCREPLNGGFRVKQIAPKDLEARRIEVLYRSLKKRGQKVAGYRLQGYRTILLLEDGVYDMSLGNEQSISQALVEASSDFQTEQLPDEVYLVTTTTDEWWFYRLRLEEPIVEKLGVWNSDTESILVLFDETGEVIRSME
ncbi:hypothetical protein ACFL6S_30565 [Candidatus Poribacteria bacterium]